MHTTHLSFFGIFNFQIRSLLKCFQINKYYVGSSGNIKSRKSVSATRTAYLVVSLFATF